MKCEFDRYEDDPDYGPSSTFYYKSGFSLHIVRVLNGIDIRPKINEDWNGICSLISRSDAEVYIWFDCVIDALTRYFSIYGNSPKILVSFKEDMSDESPTFKYIVNAFASIDYTLVRKMKKECGACENLYLMVFKHSTAEEVEQPYDHY